MEKHFQLTDDVFLTQFESCIMQPQDFTHVGHLRLVWISIKKYGIVKARDVVQSLILNFVTTAGAKDKYHVTLTIAAIEVVHLLMKNSVSLEFNEFLKEFPQLKSDFKGCINRHYSFDILESERAKKHYVEPDVLSFS